MERNSSKVLWDFSYWRLGVTMRAERDLSKKILGLYRVLGSRGIKDLLRHKKPGARLRTENFLGT